MNDGKKGKKTRMWQDERKTNKAVLRIHAYLSCVEIILFLCIASNDSLEYLDLSWNHLRRKGAIQVANGLRVIVQLQRYSTTEFRGCCSFYIQFYNSV